MFLINKTMRLQKNDILINLIASNIFVTDKINTKQFQRDQNV